MVRIWKRKHATKEEIERERKSIEEQKVLFELEIELQKEAVAFRDLYLKWLDETITLDDILDEMAKQSICGKINVWNKTHNTKSTYNPR